MTVSQCHSPNDFTLFRLTQIPSVFTQIQDLRSLKTNDNLFSGIFCSLRIVLHSKYKCLQDNWILLMISLILELRKSLVFLFKSQFNTYWKSMTIHIPGFFCSLRVIHYSKYIWRLANLILLMISRHFWRTQIPSVFYANPGYTLIGIFTVHVLYTTQSTNDSKPISCS